MWGDARFGPAVDVWSLGIVLAGMAGHAFTSRCMPHADVEETLFRHRGVPATASLRSLPWFPIADAVQKGLARQLLEPTTGRKWPAALTAKLGTAGVSLLNRCLAYEARLRPAVS